MFNALRQRKHTQRLNAIASGDLDALAKHLRGSDKTWLDDIEASPLVCAIEAGQAKALRLLLAAGANPNTLTTEQKPLLQLALEQTNSLALISELLSAKADLHTAAEAAGSPITHLCLTLSPPAQWLLHLGRLLQHGADINTIDSDGHRLLDLALAKQDQPLLQFLINSGAHLPEQWPDNLPAELSAYLERCREDQRIRAMFLNP